MSAELDTSLRGYLLKFTNLVKGFQFRWFVIDPQTGFLDYYITEDTWKANIKPRNRIFLQGSSVIPSEEDPLIFNILKNDEVLKLKTVDSKERQLWIDRLRYTAEKHKIDSPKMDNPDSTQKLSNNLLNTDMNYQNFINTFYNLFSFDTNQTSNVLNFNAQEGLSKSTENTTQLKTSQNTFATDYKNSYKNLDQNHFKVVREVLRNTHNHYTDIYNLINNTPKSNHINISTSTVFNNNNKNISNNRKDLPKDSQFCWNNIDKSTPLLPSTMSPVFKGGGELIDSKQNVISCQFKHLPNDKKNNVVVNLLPLNDCNNIIDVKTPALSSIHKSNISMMDHDLLLLKASGHETIHVLSECYNLLFNVTPSSPHDYLSQRLTTNFSDQTNNTMAFLHDPTYVPKDAEANSHKRTFKNVSTKVQPQKATSQSIKSYKKPNDAAPATSFKLINEAKKNHSNQTKHPPASYHYSMKNYNVSSTNTSPEFNSLFRHQ